MKQLLDALYGAGLAPMKCIRLRVKDVDLGHETLVMPNAKGAKVPSRSNRRPWRLNREPTRSAVGKRCFADVQWSMVSTFPGNR